jgi:hypothetical protein
MYYGEFVNGHKHGKGKWKKCPNKDGSATNAFEGQYVDDKKNGYGEFLWETGNKYKGSYIDDQKQGFGEMLWIDGSIYRGFWHDGIQHGLGIMIFQDGYKKIGFFNRNVFTENLVDLD